MEDHHEQENSLEMTLNSESPYVAQQDEPAKQTKEGIILKVTV
jgi:hypothetical protein